MSFHGQVDPGYLVFSPRERPVPKNVRLLGGQHDPISPTDVDERAREIPSGIGCNGHVGT